MNETSGNSIIPNDKKITILGIDFFNGEAQEVVDVLKSGGLLVVPSGPGMATVSKDDVYYLSLREADIAIPDSGYMVLIHNVSRRKKLKKISGWKFIVTFLADPQVQKSPFLLVDPRLSESVDNRNFMNAMGFNLTEGNAYIAPFYDHSNVIDPELLGRIEKQKPQYVLINLAGGVQEKLGAYLRKNLSYKPAIICTGAAIAFLTGNQANMPTWADKLYLGWLMRCIQRPSVYVPRYLRAFNLILLMIRYGKNAPA